MADATGADGGCRLLPRAPRLRAATAKAILGCADSPGWSCGSAAGMGLPLQQCGALRTARGVPVLLAAQRLERPQQSGDRRRSGGGIGLGARAKGADHGLGGAVDRRPFLTGQRLDHRAGFFP